MLSAVPLSIISAVRPPTALQLQPPTRTPTTARLQSQPPTPTPTAARLQSKPPTAVSSIVDVSLLQPPTRTPTAARLQSQPPTRTPTAARLQSKPPTAVSAIVDVSGGSGSGSGSGSCSGIKRSGDLTNDNIKLFSGNSSIRLAEKTAAHLGVVVGNIHDDLIKGCDVYIIQSICFDTDADVDELTIMVNLCKSNLAGRITVVLPYFGTDKEKCDKATMTRAVHMISQTGPNRVLFDMNIICPSVGLVRFGSAAHCFDSTEVITDHLLLHQRLTSAVFVSSCTDQKADAFMSLSNLRARLLFMRDIPVAVITRERPGVFNINGKHHIKGRNAILFQPEIRITNLTDGALSLRSEGAASVLACAIHARLSPLAAEGLAEGLSNGTFDEVIVTDASHVSERYCFSGLKIISVAPLLADEILSLHKQE